MPVISYKDQIAKFVGTYTGSYDCINHGIFYEQAFLEQIRSMRLAGTYLDIGTNVGTHAVYFGLFCECERVIGFEPVGRWRSHALENLAANNLLAKVEILKYGVSDRPERIPFDIAGPGTTLSCRTIDSLFPDLEDVSFVKMDIEGSEPKALLGGKEFFARNRPIIAAEVLGSTEDIFEAAKSIGYNHSGKIYASTPGSPMYEFVPM
jgi:FkbM family methyltransferase